MKKDTNVAKTSSTFNLPSKSGIPIKITADNYLSYQLSIASRIMLHFHYS